MSKPIEVLKKHVAVVHSHSTLGLLERKIYNVLLLQAYDSLMTAKEHRIGVEVLGALAGFRSRDYKTLKRVLRNLRSAQVEFNLLDDDDPNHEWTVSGLLSEASLQKGQISWSYGDRMIARLYNPAIYARISLAVQRCFTSTYAMALYENLVRFRTIGTSGFWDLNTFRKLAGATSKSYEEFKYLKKVVLDPATREINRHADILVSWEVKRGAGRGAPVTDIRFTVKPNPQYTMFGRERSAEDDIRAKPAYKALRDLGLHDRLALKTVEENEGKAMKWARHVQSEVARGRVKKSAAGLLAHLIQVDADVPSPEAADKPRATPPPIEVLRSTLRAQFEEQLAEQRLKAMPPVECSELVRRFQVKNPHLSRLCVPDKGIVLGSAYQAFLGFVLKEAVGPYEGRELDEWIRREAPAVA